jgi:hypothetical protein
MRRQRRRARELEVREHVEQGREVAGSPNGREDPDVLKCEVRCELMHAQTGALPGDVGDLDTRLQRWFDEDPVEGLERQPFPPQVGRRPARHTMEVGGEIL